MALLRMSVPGRPVEFVDLGPSPAHVSAQGFHSRGGPIDSIRVPATTAQRKAAASRSRPVIEVERCFFVMRTGEPCYRRSGHTLSHKSRQGVESDNARRRTRDFGA